jgi:hypothetical protein
MDPQENWKIPSMESKFEMLNKHYPFHHIFHLSGMVWFSPHLERTSGVYTGNLHDLFCPSGDKAYRPQSVETVGS